MKKFKLGFLILFTVLLLCFGLLGACADVGTKISSQSSSDVSSEESSSSKDNQSSSKKEVSNSSSSKTETPTESYTLTVNSIEGITITVKNGSEAVESGSNVEKGTVLTLTYDLADNYTFGYFTVNGSKVTENTITITANTTISATVSLKQYSVTITNPTGATLTVKNGATTITSGDKVDYGTKLTLSYTLIDHREFSSFTVNGNKITGDTVTITGDTTISAVVSVSKYTVTIQEVTGATISVVVGESTVVNSGAKISYGVTLKLSYSLEDNYEFVNFTINGEKYSQTTIEVTSDITISAKVTEKDVENTITAVQSTGGTIEASLKSATAGTEVTLSNTPQAGYIFSSYKVNGVSQTKNTFTMPSEEVTIEAVFVRGIDGLSYFNFTKNCNYASSTSGSVAKSGASATNTQTGYPFVYSEALGDFYYETNVTFSQSDIKNGETAPKCGIAINYGEEWMFVYIDAISSNGGYGNNTWLIATNGRGTLGSSIDWYWADVQERKFNFEKTYTGETTFKLGVLRIGAVYNFLIEDKFAYSLWLPEMNDAVNIGILSFNMTYRCTGTKLGNTTQAITNAKAYYGLTNKQNPTSVTLDGFAGDWRENAVTTYGIASDLKYFFASAFKGTNAVYAVVKARTSNYITTNSNWWESTNVELRYGAGDSYQAYASANGQKKNVTNAVFNIKEESGLYTITVEIQLPLSLWSGTPTLGFAFRSEDMGGTMCEGYSSVWWCGMTQINFQNFTVAKTGLAITRETTPTENSIRTGIQIADPFILTANGKYYYYGGDTTKYDVWESTDLKTWYNPKLYGYYHPVFYLKTDTENKSNTFAVRDLWAPEIVYNPNTKKYVMFYSGFMAKEGNDAYPKIGVATCDSPTGIFKDVYGKPLLYPDSEVASIDGSCFVDDDGQAYLYYCKDIAKNYIENYRNGQGYGVSQIWVVKLDSTYTKTVGDPVLCIQPDQDWEFAEAGNSCWNEGPYVYKYKDFYYLTYSANPFWNSSYGVGLAVSRTPLSSFCKYANNPIIKTVPGVTAGTGHSMFFKDVDGKLWCAYHTFIQSDLDWNKDTNNKGRSYPIREGMISRVWFKDGIPKIEVTR